MTVDATKVERLRQHDWGDDPFVALRGEGDEFSIKLVDGKCFFLDADKRCRIHSELGYEEKPDGCKAFPLRMARVGGEMRARLSFWCPTVSDDEGKPLRDQMRWVRATVPLPTGVACAVTASASRSAKGACGGAKAKNATTAARKSST